LVVDLFIMEFIEIIVTIVVIFAGLSVMAKIVLGKKGTKQKKVTANEQLIGVHQDTIDRLQIELRKQVGRANRYKQLSDGMEEDETNTPQISGGGQVTFEEIQGLVNQAAPKYAKFLALPFIKDKVMDITEGMSLSDVVSQLQAIKQGAGDLKPESSDTESNTSNPNYA